MLNLFSLRIHFFNLKQLLLKMDGAAEIYNFSKVWLSVFISLTYCHVIGKIIPNGSKRLLCFLPIISLFLILPLKLSSLHLGGITSFFIAWLANFKLLLFALGKGPLSSSHPPLSLPRFIATACFPIKIQQNKETPDGQNPKRSHKSPLNYAIKSLLLASIIRAYDYTHYFHPKFLLLLYGFHIFFVLELTLAILATLVRAMFKLELEPQFNEPYLSTSLQDFWGRRWNLMASSILRLTVYEPVLHFCSPVIGRKWAPLPSVFGTFVVSAIMHEVIFYHLGRVRPTFEITWFFLFHGACLVVEIALKKGFLAVKRWRSPTVASVFLTDAFVMVTAFWWFFPTLLRCDAEARAFEEYAAVAAFLKDIGRALTITKYKYVLN